MELECHRSWRFVRRHFQLWDTSPIIPNWPWTWPCWNCTGSYKFSVSVKKMGGGWTGGNSNIVKAEGSGIDPRATGGLVSNLPHPWVNKTKQYAMTAFRHAWSQKTRKASLLSRQRVQNMPDRCLGHCVEGLQRNVKDIYLACFENV